MKKRILKKNKKGKKTKIRWNDVWGCWEHFCPVCNAEFERFLIQNSKDFADIRI